MIHRITNSVESGIFVLMSVASPRTFGIKYGCLAMSFVQFGKFFGSLLVLLLGDQIERLDIASLASSILALLICITLFKETLDIKTLQSRRLVIFQDFGIEVDYEKLNYSINSSRRSSNPNEIQQGLLNEENTDDNSKSAEN